MSAPTSATMAAHLVATADALPDSASLLAGMVMDRLRWAADSKPPVVLDAHGNPASDAAGLPKTPEGLIADFKREMPSLFNHRKIEAPASAAGPWRGDTAKALAEHGAAQQRQPTGDRPNPYLKSSRNLTEQVRLEARDPVRAARLKAEAGVA